MEPDCSAQWQFIPAAPNRGNVSLQRATTELQCPTAGYRCSAQTHNISAVLNGKVSLLCPAPAKLNPTAFAPAVPNCNIIAVRLQGCKEDSLGGGTPHFLGNNGFRAGMLEVNDVFICIFVRALVCLYACTHMHIYIYRHRYSYRYVCTDIYMYIYPRHIMRHSL